MTVKTLDDVKMRIGSGESVFEIFMIQTDAYPFFPEVEQGSKYKVDQFTLKRMFSQTSFAINTNEMRNMSVGLLLESEGTELRAVAVDGYRIALRKQPVDPVKQNMKMIIPARTVNELIKIIPSEMGDLYIYDSDNQAIIEFGHCRVYTHMIAGEFFNYRRIIPMDYTTKATVNRRELLTAVKSILNTGIKDCRLSIADSKNSLTLIAKNDIATIQNKQDATVDGQPISISINPSYLVDALKAINDVYICIKFNTHNKPIVIEPTNGNAYLYLIMPFYTKK